MRAWPPALRSAALAPRSADSTPRTCPPRSWVQSQSSQTVCCTFHFSSCASRAEDLRVRALGHSPWVSVAPQVVSQVPQEMLLREKQSHAQRQQLPALQRQETELTSLYSKKSLSSCSVSSHIVPSYFIFLSRYSQSMIPKVAFI